MLPNRGSVKINDFNTHSSGDDHTTIGQESRALKCRKSDEGLKGSASDVPVHRAAAYPQAGVRRGRTGTGVEQRFQLQPGCMDKIVEARLEAEARKSEEALKNAHGHLATIRANMGADSSE